MRPEKRSYSVEDITAALDDMIQEDHYLNNDHNDIVPPPQGFSSGGASLMPAASEPSGHTVGNADDELDALSKALQSFPGKSEPEPGEEV